MNLFNRNWRFLATVISLLILNVNPCEAQTQGFQKAVQLSHAGEYDKAGQLLQNLLQSDQENVQIRMALAFNDSWRGNYELARRQFRKLIENDSHNSEALKGYGYTLAWMEDYPNAKYPFIEMIRIGEQTEEAKKGLAYVYLWQGSYKVAESFFQELHDLHPTNEEYLIALSQCLMKQNKSRSARNMLATAIGTSQSNRDIQKLITDTYQSRPFIALQAMGGYSEINGLHRIGLRSLSTNWNFHSNWQFQIEYDNGHSLDNLFLLTRNLNAEAIWIGATHDFDKHHQGRVQFGRRFFSEQSDQTMISGHYTYFSKNNSAIQVGSLVNLTAMEHRQVAGYAGVQLPVSNGFYFTSQYWVNIPVSQPHTEHRILLGAQAHFPGGASLQVAGLLGTRIGGGEIMNQNISGALLHFRFPLISNLNAILISRYENDLAGDLISISAGVQLRIER